MQQLESRKSLVERLKPTPLGHFVGWGPRLV
jgi:hypothetical protein